MYAGRIVEMQSVRGLFYDPRYPRPKALLDSIPKLGTKAPLYAIPWPAAGPFGTASRLQLSPPLPIRHRALRR